jgi:preprotein translocase subunit SecD
MQHFKVLIVATLVLTGCNFDAGPPRIIDIGGTESLSQNDQRIVATRLDSYTPRGWLRQAPSFVFRTHEGGVRVTASSAPSDTEIQYLLLHRGKFEVATEYGTLWFNEHHIVDSAIAIDEQNRKTLRLRLNEEGAARLSKLSSTGLPTVLLVKFDGDVLVAAKLAAPISEGRLEVTIDKPVDELLLMVEVLKSGRLSFDPTSVKVSAPSN